MEIGAGDRPDQDKHAAANERRRGAHQLGSFLCKTAKERFHAVFIFARRSPASSNERMEFSNYFGVSFTSLLVSGVP